MVKNCTQKTIYIKKNKKIKKFNKYYPPSPLLSSFSSLLSENRNKIAKKMYYPTLCSSELKQDSIAVAY